MSCVKAWYWVSIKLQPAAITPMAWRWSFDPRSSYEGHSPSVEVIAMNSKKDAEKPKFANEPDLHPDAWDRFRQAVHVMTKAGPQHRIEGAAVKSGAKERPASKGRVYKGKSRS